MFLAQNEWLFIQFRGRYSRTGGEVKKNHDKQEREDPPEMRRQRMRRGAGARDAEVRRCFVEQVSLLP